MTPYTELGLKVDVNTNTSTSTDCKIAKCMTSIESYDISTLVRRATWLSVLSHRLGEVEKPDLKLKRFCLKDRELSRVRLFSDRIGSVSRYSYI